MTFDEYTYIDLMFPEFSFSKYSIGSSKTQYDISNMPGIYQ